MENTVVYDRINPTLPLNQTSVSLSTIWASRGGLMPRLAGSDAVRFITSAGYATIRAEYEQLFGTERPKLVETISWAAGIGDRSENGDYIYGKKRLREIDRRLSWLARVMKAAKVVDPAAHVDREKVYFGATVELADEADARRILTIVGDDELIPPMAASAGRPDARALRGAKVGEERIVELPAGEKSYEVVAITYPRRTRSVAAMNGTTAPASSGGAFGNAFLQSVAIAPNPRPGLRRGRWVDHRQGAQRVSVWAASGPAPRDRPRARCRPNSAGPTR